uniref:Uncharacterized protein n=1 Tax=Siphoviridae sp. ct7OC5 TaxID=2825350 RepID=A0A8S5TSR7_9CAUD|nr:MAG TPA: hypothetical protein [Siphoviridae sp. ct7OC5]
MQNGNRLTITPYKTHKDEHFARLCVKIILFYL